MKLLGGIFLIAGTCIGGGMLGLPIVTAQAGLLNTLLLFIGCWALMTFSAYLTLEVAQLLPQDANIITMAKATLGRGGEICSWTIYLLFLYALEAAYISSGQDILNQLFSYLGFYFPNGFCSILFVALFGGCVMAGTQKVDLINRVLMLIKFSALVLLVTNLAPHIAISNFAPGQLNAVVPAFSVAITSFGFSIIIPTLKTHLNNDIRLVRLSILGGSLCALFCYSIWVAVIFGAVPIKTLSQLAQHSGQVSDLMRVLNTVITSSRFHLFANVFTIICIFTAFMCVSLSLSDYLADGCGHSKNTLKDALFNSAITFLPPLAIVMFYPKSFILFLSYAGILCFTLQAVMPMLMAWKGRDLINSVRTKLTTT